MILAKTTAQRRFTPSYSESVTLADGRRVTLRLARPDDADRLRRGFEGLSEAARYQRFFGAKSALGPDELRALLDCDGEERLAIGAIDAADEGVGVARFVRLREDPAIAEGAITVADRCQRSGLGTALLSRLLEAAAERGLRALALFVLSDNAAMLALARKVAKGTRVASAHHVGPSVIEVVLPVPLSPSAE